VGEGIAVGSGGRTVMVVGSGCRHNTTPTPAKSAMPMNAKIGYLKRSSSGGDDAGDGVDVESMYPPETM
jgi:hypothetical protein